MLITQFNKFISRVLYPVFERVQKRNIRSKLPQLYAHYASPLHERRERNKRQLYAILVHAYKNIPYYRELFFDVNFSPEDVLEDVHSLERIPYLTKEIVRERRQDLCCSPEATKLFLRQTGGSTGPRANFWYDQEGLDWTAATNLLAYEWAGHFLGQREAHLSTLFNTRDKLKSRFIEYCKCKALNRRNLYTDSLADETLEEVCQLLHSVRPHLVQGPPSTFYALAMYAERNGLSPKGLLKIVETTSEKFEAHKRGKVEEIFGCEVFDRYGAAEFGVIAHEFVNGNGKKVMKLMDHLVWAEVAPLGGNLHELVLTGLTNPAMPLIRYRMGDLGSVATQDDDLVIDRLEGRVHDTLIMGGKVYPTHYFLDSFTRLGNVVDFQLLVNEKDELERVLMVSYTRPEHQQKMRTQVQKWFQHPVQVEFCQLSDLQRCGWRNKFSYVVRTPKKDKPVDVQICTGAEKPKVAIVNHSLAINGANNHVREVLRLFSFSCDFTVYSISEGVMRAAYEENLGVTVVVMDADHLPDFSSFDLVLGNTLMTSHVLVEAAGQGVPTALTVHESWHPTCLAQHINAFEFGDYISEEVVRTAVKSVNALVFPAAFQADLYRPLLSEQRGVEHVYCTIPFEEIEDYMQSVSKGKARQALNVNNPDEIVFLQVGTITHRKNQRGTVAAFAEFRTKYPDISCRLILLGARNSRKGERDYARSVQQAINNKGLADCVSVVATTFDPYPYFRAADIVIHPSYNEVLPLSIIEAGAFEVPCVASSLDGLSEVIDHGRTGYLAQPNDLCSLVGHMHALATSSALRRKVGGAASAFVKEQHNKERFIAGYSRVFFALQ